jgi:PAS domain S-box-containing protein
MARPESLADGSVCWHGLLLDITVRKEAEKNQFRTNSLLDGIFTQNPYPIWISDRYGSLIRMNRACKAILERVQNGVVGTYNILLDRRIREQGFLTLVRSVFDEGNTAEFLLELGERPEPEQYFSVFEVTVSPVKDEQGMVTNAIVMYNDITEQKRAEADLRLTQFCIDQAGLSIFRIEEPDGRVVFANDRACKSLGYTMEELCSMTVFDFDPNFTKRTWLEHRRNIRSKKSGTIETMHRRKDGTMFPVEVSVTYLEYEGKTYSYSFAIDITERKKAEALLREAKAEAARVGTLPSGWRACLGLASVLDRRERTAEAAAERAEARRLLDAVAADLPSDLRTLFEATEVYRRARAPSGRSS